MASNRRDILNTVFNDSFWLLCIRVLGMGSAMLLMLILARQMPPAELGDYATAMSAALLGGLFCTANFGAGAVRFVNQYRAADEWGLLYQYFLAGKRIIVGCAAFALVIAVAAYSWFYFSGVEFIASSLIISLLAMPLLARLRLDAANSHALGYIVRSGVSGMLIRPVLLFLAVLASVYFEISLSANYVMLVFMLTLVCANVIQFFLFRPVFNLPFPKPPIAKSAKQSEWIRVAVQLLVPVLFLEFSIDVIILLAAMVLEAEDIAVLSIALRLQSIVLFGVTSINMAMGPKLAQCYSEGNRELMVSYLNVSGHLKFWPSLLALVLLYFIGDWLLGFFGAHYQGYVSVLLILCLCPLILAFYGPTVLFMTLANMQGRANYLFLWSLLLLVGLVLILGFAFGIHGVASAMVIVWAVWNHILSRWIKAKDNVETSLVRW